MVNSKPDEEELPDWPVLLLDWPEPVTGRTDGVDCAMALPEEADPVSAVDAGAEAPEAADPAPGAEVGAEALAAPEDAPAGPAGSAGALVAAPCATACVA